MKSNVSNTTEAGCKMRSVGWIVALAGVVGCSGPPSVITNEMDPAQDQLLRIAAAYRQVNLDRGTPPRSAAELEPLLKSRGDGPEVLVSPRDGEPFVIAWGTEMPQFPVDVENPTVIAHEKLGKDGSRFVMMEAGNVQLLSEEEFAAAQFARGIQPE